MHLVWMHLLVYHCLLSPTRDPPRLIHPLACYSNNIMPPLSRRTWNWTFDLPPSVLWPVLAATNRFNEAMGLPPYLLEEVPQPNGTVLHHAGARRRVLRSNGRRRPMSGCCTGPGDRAEGGSMMKRVDLRTGSL
jgi:hypothetical protein